VIDNIVNRLNFKAVFLFIAMQKDLLTFDHLHLGDTYIKQINGKVRNCYFYKLTKNNLTVANLYFGDKISFIDLPGKPMLLKRNRPLFKEESYLLTDLITQEEICFFRFSVWQTAFALSATIRFADQSAYLIRQNNLHRRLFKPSTWWQYRFQMQSANDTVSYVGVLKGRRLDGEISTTNSEIIVPIITGLYAIDEKFRVRYERFRSYT
jgi:hypothetical protein